MSTIFQMPDLAHFFCRRHACFLETRVVMKISFFDVRTIVLAEFAPPSVDGWMSALGIKTAIYPLLLKGVKSRRNFKCQNCKHANPPTHTRASGDFSRCDPAGIQTQDLQNRNLTLYSAKLRSHFFSWCKDSARRAENKRKTCFSFFSRAAAYLGRKPKCARRAENKRKTCFSFTSEVQPILWMHSKCVRVACPWNLQGV